MPDAVFIEYPSFFHPERRPVYILDGTYNVHKHMSTGEIIACINKIDSVLKARSSLVKGIIHVTSYERGPVNVASIVQRSKFSSTLLTHDRRSLGRTVERFRNARPPSVLLSPAVREGFDFAHDQCRFQIIAKVPFVDHTNAVAQARHRDDKLYLTYLVVQSLIQMCGRGMRAEDDWCETFITDGAIRFVLAIANKNKLLPKWFKRSIQYVSSIPPAPSHKAVRPPTRPSSLLR